MGLDIHEDEIRLLQIRKIGTRFCIEKLALASLPPGAIEDGKIKQFNIVLSVLSRLVQKTKTQAALTAIALPANSVINSKITLAANFEEGECETEISSNVNRYFPGATDDICFDFVTINPIDEENNEVLLVASRSEQLNAYVNVVKQAGLKIKIVDVDSYALIRATNFILPSHQARDVIAILEVSASVATFIVFHQKNILFTQRWRRQESVRLEEKLAHVIQLFQSTHRNIKISCFVLIGKNTTLSKDMGASPIVHLNDINPFKVMLLAPKINKEELQRVSSRLLVALGLGMRSIPQW